MELFGAEHYYFWQGVEQGQTAPRRSVERLSEDVLDIGMDISKLCLEAYLLGFCMGKALTVADYHDILGINTNYDCEAGTLAVDNVTEAIAEIEEKIEPVIEEEPDLLDQEFPLKGNC